MAAKALAATGRQDQASLKRAALYASYDAAAKDDDFRKRMSAVASDFAMSVADGLQAGPRMAFSGAVLQ